MSTFAEHKDAMRTAAEVALFGPFWNLFATAANRPNDRTVSDYDDARLLRMYSEDPNTNVILPTLNGIEYMLTFGGKMVQLRNWIVGNELNSANQSIGTVIGTQIVVRRAIMGDDDQMLYIGQEAQRVGDSAYESAMNDGINKLLDHALWSDLAEVDGYADEDGTALTPTLASEPALEDGVISYTIEFQTRLNPV